MRNLCGSVIPWHFQYQLTVNNGYVRKQTKIKFQKTENVFSNVTKTFTP